MADFVINVPDPMLVRILDSLVGRYPELAPCPPEVIGQQGFAKLVRELLQGVERNRIDETIRVQGEAARAAGYASVDLLLSQIN